MVKEFKLPDLGEGVHEGEVLNVFVSVGDQVKEGEPILEVETDKAAVEIPSPFTGKVKEIKVKAGDTVQVGDVLITFSDVEGAEAEEEKAEPKEKEARPEEERKKEKRPPEEEEKEAKAEPAKEEKEAREEKRREGPVPASPATRRLARELGVDLRKVTPSGPGGRVTAGDVKAFAKKPEEKKPEEEKREEEAPPKRPETRPLEEKPPTIPDFTKWGEVERVPVRSIRRATARQMALAWSQIPHVHNQDMVDLTKLEEFRKKHKEEVEDQGGKLSVTVFAVKAAAAALRQFPRFNASLDVEAGEMVLKHYYHIGVAAATDEGLVVPVIRDVDRKSIREIAVELNDLIQRTRERKVSLEEMQGATFTITNVGPMGGGYFAPIINFPEVAILGMGAGRMQPVAQDKGGGKYEIVPRLMMPIVLCIDHRVLDGADALQFMRVFIEALEDPESLFLMMT